MSYKYKNKQLRCYQTEIKGIHATVRQYIDLHENGFLFLSDKYEWDGVTFFPDYKELLDASAVHDALYQLISVGQLPRKFKSIADKDFLNRAKLAGLGWFKLLLIRIGLLIGGRFFL